MKHTVFTKTLYDRRWFMIGWTLGFVGFSALMASFYPAMHQDGALDALVENMPPAFEGLIGNLANLKTFELYLASQLFDIRLPLIAGIMAIILGQGLSTSEEDRGELRTMVSLPISRTKLLLHKWLALVVITGVATIGLGVGIYATVPFISNATLGFNIFLQLIAMTWVLMVAFGTVAFSIGMLSGSKGLATLVSILVIIGSFILSTFAPAVEWLQKIEKISLIYYFPATDVVHNGIAAKNVVVLGGVTLVMLVVAWVIFRRRDIKA